MQRQGPHPITNTRVSRWDSLSSRRATCADVRLTGWLAGTRAPAVTVAAALGAALSVSRPPVGSPDQTDVLHGIGGLNGYCWSPCNEELADMMAHINAGLVCGVKFEYSIM